MDMPPLLRRRWAIFTAGVILLALIAWADLHLNDAVPLALLYIVPIVLLSTVLNRSQVGLLGILCALVAEFADEYPWNVEQGIPRDILYLLAYESVGFYVTEFVSRRRAERLHVMALETEMAARRGAEEQLRLVLATSSLAIVTSDADGTILDANSSAEDLFFGESLLRGPLVGRSMTEFIPSLARVQIQREGWQQMKTMMQCQGFRSGRQPFLADVWFSSYKTSHGGRLTSMIVDTSAELRDREEGNLEQVLAGSRLAVGALAHEIRNICAAIAVVQTNLLAKSPHLLESEDFLALQKLTLTLGNMSSVELSRVKRQSASLDLQPFFRDLYIIISASLRDAAVDLRWNVPDNLTSVWADAQSLLQVILNLIRNAETALARTVQPYVDLTAKQSAQGVEICVSDNGPGVTQPEQLFNPFCTNLGKGGFGLYLSKAMMLSFQGDLRYVPTSAGAAFVLDLVVAEAP